MIPLPTRILLGVAFMAWLTYEPDSPAQLAAREIISAGLRAYGRDWLVDCLSQEHCP